ncbi:MAG: selenocysteine-specific translation elongation factor [Calditrichaeota bacterium]|nr:selenocysteine-specific translation elongation factor [Calditrichota bacterium]
MRTGRQYVIGTAGHIDHGKTALVKALTGVDTDRLPEEKARGITIDLGFAHLNDRITIIDVPGHERLIKNMVAGVSTIDLVLFVVAADDGLMPQTHEHLEIVRLLNIPRGVFALTKIDLVSPEWCELVKSELQNRLKGTPFEQAPIVPTSVVTGEGIQTLRETLLQMLREIPPRMSRDYFRMPVDRVFTRKGFGTIVTGTVLSGQLTTGTLLELQPSGKTVRVRGLQTHGRDVDSVETGDRAALNLAGVEQQEVKRGMVLITPDYAAPAESLTVYLQVLSDSPIPLKSHQRIRLHIHTEEVMGRLVIPGNQALPPGRSAYIQIRLEKPIQACYGDRFIVRQYSPQVTLGGGMVLQVNPPRFRKKWESLFLETARQLHQGTPEERILALLNPLTVKPLSFRQLQVGTDLPAGELTRRLQSLLSRKDIHSLILDGHPHYFSRFQARVILHDLQRILEKYHHDHTLLPGMPRKELLAAMPHRYHPDLIAAVLDLGIQGNHIQVVGNRLALPAHATRSSADTEAWLQRLRNAIESAEWRPQPIESIGRELEIPRKTLKTLLTLLIESGEIYPVNHTYYLSRDAYQKMVQRVRDYFQKKAHMRVSDFKTLLNITRKHAIPLLEFLDARGITRREGDVRLAGDRLQADP